MTYTNNPTGTGTQTQSKNIQPHEVKNLVQKEGKTTIGNKEFCLKSPSHTDSQLQEIIKDPALTVKPTSNSSANGECEYELSANGKSVKIKVECKETN